MPATWQTDLSAAEDQAILWSEQTGSNKGWPESVRDYAVDMITECAEFATTAGEFWALLRDVWADAGEANSSLGDLNGWSQLAATWASAVEAASSAAEEKRMGQYSTIILDTLELTAEDIADAARHIPDPEDWGKGLALLALVAAAAFGASR